ncbi:hypothetical protein SRB5_64680 [Streptomyces sp. RB5]|uniref:Uncharacterized protein n=1 Tax=Streptomyces smaragdinus TaxID=2585196 RepID=A0A7K0CS61_9ACTN|nr:hypothetical protein [Streptomyces smaragdinus]MQY16270.1 hypothetical protein [Streptomyces smaragdinus]
MESTITKLVGRPVTASCPIAVSERGLRGTGLSGSRSGLALGSSLGSVAVVKRPTQAPVAAPAEAKQAYAGVIAGAGLQEQTWAFGGHIAAGATDANEQHQTMRGYRGPEPWQDPS